MQEIQLEKVIDLFIISVKSRTWLPSSLSWFELFAQLSHSSADRDFFAIKFGQKVEEGPIVWIVYPQNKKHH